MPYSYQKGRYVHDFQTLKNLGSDIVLTHAAKPEYATRIDIERNLTTYATSRSGKGATQIIPNLLHWSHNALVIDPKGEAAEATAEAREAMGQAVHVLDPFNSCKVPDRFRARLNLLDEIDPASPDAFRQINAIADGIIMRHNDNDGHWDDGAQKVLSGFIAHALTSGSASSRSLIGMRELLIEPDPEAFGKTVGDMSQNPACGRLPIGAAGKLTKTGKEGDHFLSGATANTEWMDDPYMASCLSESTFRLSDLKRKPMTVYLVLPLDALADYGRFLRLFVRVALYHMMQKMPNGSLKGERCLFILDEFYSLGKISEIQKAVGGLPGANLHLWPFLQDLNQMIEVYGKEGASTFTANSDLIFFYGVDDPDTAEWVSHGAGRITEKELQISPPPKPRPQAPPVEYANWLAEFFGLRTTQYENWARGRVQPAPDFEGKPVRWKVEEYNTHSAVIAAQERSAEAQYVDAMNRYHHAQQSIGHPRLSPDEIYRITRKNPKRNVCDHAIMFRSGDCYQIDLVAHWEDPISIKTKAKADRLPSEPKSILNIKGLDQISPEELKAAFADADAWAAGRVLEGIDLSGVHKIPRGETMVFYASPVAHEYRLPSECEPMHIETNLLTFGSSSIFSQGDLMIEGDYVAMCIQNSGGVVGWVKITKPPTPNPYREEFERTGNWAKGSVLDN